jgi:hypothetical protein
LQKIGVFFANKLILICVYVCTYISIYISMYIYECMYDGNVKVCNDEMAMTEAVTTSRARVTRI